MDYSLDIWIFGIRSAMKGDGLGVSKQIEPAKIVDLGPRSFQKLGTVNNDRKALSPANRYVETIGVKQEFGTAWSFGALGGGHGNYDDRGLLPLDIAAPQ
jgi:hypothetical protein